MGELRSTETKWFEQICIAGVNIDFKIDTGAEGSILTWDNFKKLPKTDQDRPKLTKITLSSYDNFACMPVGQIDLMCHFGNIC